MSSFFTVPGSQKKRKRPTGPEAPKKRPAAPKTNGRAAPSRKNAPPTTQARKKRVERDESISGSESDDDERDEQASSIASDAEASGSEEEAETAAEARLRLAERYLENVKQQVDEAGFDAADLDRDLIAERLEEDVAETKGKVYRNLTAELAFDKATHCQFRSNTKAITAVATREPYAYTASKDLHLHKWRIQDLPENQYPKSKKRKPKKAPAPPRKKPELDNYIKGNRHKTNDKDYKRHVDEILCVAASPDGKYVATGGADRRLIIYDAETLSPIRVFTHHRDAVTGLVFRRGTNQLYSCSKDRTVKVWSLDEMAYVETLFGHQDDVVDIDALAQERCVSVGSRDRTARLWKVAEESQLVFRGGGASDKKNRPAGIDPVALRHEGSMDRVAMIDDELFVTGGDNGSISLWSTTKKKPQHIVPAAHGLEDALTPAQYSAEVNPDPRAAPVPVPRHITALRTIPYSDLILSGSWDGQVRVWRLSEDKKFLEPLGSLGQEADADEDEEVDGDGGAWGIKGVINDISVFERGEKGTDGLCVVVAVGKEQRLGRWRIGKGGKNGGVVFEVPRVQRLANGISKDTLMEDAE
ncbi:related to a component of the yeast U3 snoRNP Rrp9p [Cephalotrichum gorgonifer]|uniref:Related to a component of the yeast U3 snoRNP Rrp9p n=1 Tax=Cephalotrichum gorgonifer TaxID=2041049 RepID=A0AAE8MV94_9PEZI|nr:related to a component of the yeast U3 snoRNP Rrp9p [Cephalotrichum gorgonifer]